MFFDKLKSTKKEYAHISFHLTQMDFTIGTPGPIHLVYGYSRDPSKAYVPIHTNTYYNHNFKNKILTDDILKVHPEFESAIDILSK